MKQLAVGILAHVDAGKTTLSEGLLFESGMISKKGRVDNQNSFLDNNAIERARGITIFSKQAILEYNDMKVTLLDTPGHIDFSAEMERTLWVMDYAILVISGLDGIQGHTLTLWRLLEKYQIPTFIFVNKMDRPETDQTQRMLELREQFGEKCVCFLNDNFEEFEEQIAVCNDSIMEAYLEGISIEKTQIIDMIANREVFPCYFGSALYEDGIRDLLDGIYEYTKQKQEEVPLEEFGARIFKIARDQQGNRLTYMKITSGCLNNKAIIRKSGMQGTQWEEKCNQIRIYSGEQYEMVQTAPKGCVCAVTGLAKSLPGEGVGCEEQADMPILEPVLVYHVELPEEMDAAVALPLFRQLEEEEPELHVIWQEETKSIGISLMGEVQLEILTNVIQDRFGFLVKFGVGDIVYKETIQNKVEGVGHFEPLRHYAEVHLLLEPGEPGSGMQFLINCSEDVLDKNWQRLILTHLEEKEHLGVLTGSAITDMRITVVGGRAHTKHTEGGDFRQATYRAVRQGLMQAESVLLEPYYAFKMELPIDCLGRAMTDVENMCGHFEPPTILEERAILEGSVPVATMRDYQITMNSYTKGMGSLFCSLKGYGPCHNVDEVIAAHNYQPDEDMDNPSSSVFCSHGSGFIVPWNQVKEYMHVEGVLEQEDAKENILDLDTLSLIEQRKASLTDYSIDEEQIEAIMNRTFHANENAKKHWKKKKAPMVATDYKGQPKPRFSQKYMIVDGYNIVHAWEELMCLVQDNLEGARLKLMDILCNYQAFTKMETIVVFDAYKVKGNLGEMFDYHNIHVVYTKEAETADAYIEKLTHRISRDYQVTVATSDGLVQLITRGNNCIVMSARELKEEIERVNESIRQYLNQE